MQLVELMLKIYFYFRLNNHRKFIMYLFEGHKKDLKVKKNKKH